MPRQVFRSGDCGLSATAFSRFRMCAASSAGETEWGSRHGTGSIRTGAVSLRETASGRTSSSAVEAMALAHLDLEFRIAERAHFRKIETFQFRLRPHALADSHIDQPVHHERDREAE